jgi:hypothetical protein
VLTGKSPDQWGFEHGHTFLSGGAANHFAHEIAGSKNYAEDGVYVQPGQPGQPGGPSGTPEVFYSTDFFTQKLIQNIDAHIDDGQPFFAFGACRTSASTTTPSSCSTPTPAPRDGPWPGRGIRRRRTTPAPRKVAASYIVRCRLRRFVASDI